MAALDLVRLTQKAADIFRNLLVHGYGAVDNAIMLRHMRENLADVEEFLHHVGQLVGEAR